MESSAYPEKMMIHIVTVGSESGILQALPSSPVHNHLMFSAWVYVYKGMVEMQTNQGNSGPAAYSTAHNQWEELHVCPDDHSTVDTLVIYNQDPSGGDFLVDRVVARQTSIP